LQPTPPELLAIEKECSVRSPLFRFTTFGDVLVIPDPNESYEALDCVITALKRPEFSKFATKIGFVGNEAYAREEQK
jgi:hypothetical protein